MVGQLQPLWCSLLDINKFLNLTLQYSIFVFVAKQDGGVFLNLFGNSEDRLTCEETYLHHVKTSI